MTSSLHPILLRSETVHNAANRQSSEANLVWLYAIPGGSIADA